jgi:hypothetical protein
MSVEGSAATHSNPVRATFDSLEAATWGTSLRYRKWPLVKANTWILMCRTASHCYLGPVFYEGSKMGHVHPSFDSRTSLTTSALNILDRQKRAERHSPPPPSLTQRFCYCVNPFVTAEAPAPAAARSASFDPKNHYTSYHLTRLHRRC